MKWSISLGNIAGIPVNVHATFLLLLVWIGAAHWLMSGSLITVLDGIMFILALFGCVLLHELGHALAARRYGISTKDITLLPIGGVARLARMPDKPTQELWVALAGPAVNVAIAAALFAFLVLTGSLAPVETLGMGSGSFIERLMLVNLILVGFNLLPAFPMDGGRVLRAVLAMRMRYQRATRIAATLGQATAFGFGFIGLLTNPLLIVIAVFIWIGASQEAAMADTRSVLKDIPVSSAMLTDFKVLHDSDNLSRAVDLILAGSQREFPVIGHDGMVGLLTGEGLLKGLRKAGPQASVMLAVDQSFLAVEKAEMLNDAMVKMQEAGASTAPVFEYGRLVGIVTTDNISELIAIREALSESGARQLPSGVDTPIASTTS